MPSLEPTISDFSLGENFQKIGNQEPSEMRRIKNIKGEKIKFALEITQGPLSPTDNIPCIFLVEIALKTSHIH